ncbi:MAG: apolipoprotein N-acyltransferase [Verrucomicrobiota bacterium]
MADNKSIPLAVDLDGTLIRTDLMFESLARLLRRNPLAIFQILFWWLRGRAWLKHQLAARVRINPGELPYHEPFLEWLVREKQAGRQLVLATASDLKMAQPVADHVGIFDEVMASNGKTNLRSANKLRALTEKFGERGFDYAGNSTADFAVWRGAREAVVVNASRAVRREAANSTKLGPVFCDDYTPLETARSFCRELFWRSGYLAAVFAGLLLSSAFPKLSFAGFAWIAPALMVFAAHGKSGADAFRAGYAGGLAFWLASLYWLLLIPYPFFPILGWIALAAYLALFFAAWVWLVGNFKFANSNWANRLGWSIGGAAAWVALEMLRAWLFGGFPWSFLGVSQYKLVPLIQIASVTGVYGVSFLVAWFSLALFCAAQMIYRHPAKRHVWQAEIVLPLLVIIFCFVGGFFAMSRGSATGDFLRVTMVQPSIPQTAIWNPDVDENYFQEFLAQNEKALTNPTDLLIWPESAVPEMSVENVHQISALAREHHVWLILNGEDLAASPTETNYFNAAFLVNPEGLLTAAYHKQKLVIFGEYVPLVNWLPFLKWFTPIVGGWTPGDKAVTFSLTGLDGSAGGSTNIIYVGAPDKSRHEAKTSTLICFEDTFPGVARKAAHDNLDFFINLTNDGWFGTGSEQWQHMANSVFRAVENGLPLLRCCNNGVTCYIDGHGRIEDLFREGNGSEYGKGVLAVKIPLLSPDQKSTATYYNLHGDFFGWGCVVLTAVMIGRKIKAGQGERMQ